MRRMKWIAVLAIVPAAGLAACEQRPADQAPATEQQQTQTAAPAETAAAPTQAPSGAAPEGATPEMVAAGQQIFTGQGICFTCHGMDGKGTQLGPDLTSGNWLWVNAAQGDILGQVQTVIKNGVPQPKQYPAPMPPMGGAQLSDEQVRDVAAYVVSISGGKS